MSQVEFEALHAVVQEAIKTVELLELFQKQLQQMQKAPLSKQKSFAPVETLRPLVANG